MERLLLAELMELPHMQCKQDPRDPQAPESSRAALTNQKRLEVQVDFLKRDSRVSGVTHQEERDCDVVFGNGEGPEGFSNIQMLGNEFKYDLERKRQVLRSGTGWFSLCRIMEQ